MRPPIQPKSKITRRLAEDLRIRNRSEATVRCYVAHVERFEEFLGSIDPRQATPGHLRQFQLKLIDAKLAWSTFNQAVCALRFLYRHTIPQPWSVVMIPYAKQPRNVPIVLGHDEVERLIECVESPKNRACLLTLYACGLRIAEATALTIADVDSSRMQMQIRNGKGQKSRLVTFSPKYLRALRRYWKIDRPRHFLFPGKHASQTIGHETLGKAIKRAARKARIIKPVTPHTLRHSYATGMLEAGVDLLAISRQLGHTRFSTTMIYLHARQPQAGLGPTPAGWLPVHQLPGWQASGGSMSRDCSSDSHPS